VGTGLPRQLRSAVSEESLAGQGSRCDTAVIAAYLNPAVAAAPPGGLLDLGIILNAESSGGSLWVVIPLEAR